MPLSVIVKSKNTILPSDQGITFFLRQRVIVDIDKSLIIEVALSSKMTFRLSLTLILAAGKKRERRANISALKEARVTSGFPAPLREKARFFFPRSDLPTASYLFLIHMNRDPPIPLDLTSS